MKLSRRSAIGTLVGGITAGPSTAAAAIKEAAMNLGATERSYGDGPQTIKGPGDHRSYLLDRKLRLERHARGEFDDEKGPPRNYFPAGDPALDNIDCLRSVSLSVKRQMAAENHRRRVRENRMAEAHWELQHVLRDLGLI